MMDTIKTTKLSSKRQITIPKEFSEFKEGEKALIMGKGNQILLRAMPKTVSETAMLSQEALGEAWNSQEDEEAFAYLQK